MVDKRKNRNYDAWEIEEVLEVSYERKNTALRQVSVKDKVNFSVADKKDIKQSCFDPNGSEKIKFELIRLSKDHKEEINNFRHNEKDERYFTSKVVGEYENRCSKEP